MTIILAFGIALQNFAQESLIFSHDEDASYASLVPADHGLVSLKGISSYSNYAADLTSLLPLECNIDAVDILDDLSILFSLCEDVELKSGVCSDDDLLIWDGAFIKKFWDGSDNGLPAEVNIDALDVIAESPLIFSFSLEEDAVLPGAGKVADEDVIRFQSGKGFLSDLDFDGSLQGLDPGADLNAFSRIDKTVWILSLDVATTMKSGTFDDGDLIRFDSQTSVFTTYFNAQKKGLPDELQMDAVGFFPPGVPTPTPTPIAPRDAWMMY